MGMIHSLAAVVILILVAFVGAGQLSLHVLFGVIVPYAAVLVFFVGLVAKILQWARSPVPFRIPTTCGQGASMPWIPQSKIDNPSTALGVIKRMVLEILLFRSLFRNTRLDYRADGFKIAYGSEKLLWLAAIAFHYAFLTTLIRHLRFFTEPIPQWLLLIENVDGFLEFGLPPVMISGVVLLAAAGYLFNRRVTNPQVKYVSLPADYFPLLLIIGIAVTGLLMRYFLRVDIFSVKTFTMSLVAFSPNLKVLGNVGVIFFIHLFLICTLFAYFPFSKLMHLGGVFMSPTRNMINNNRMKRHVNPWSYPVKVHDYAHYEDDFRELMIEAGIPVEKETSDKPAGQEA